MFRTGTLVCAIALTLVVVACGPTPSQVNESGHDPYQTGDYPAALDAYERAEERAPERAEPSYNAGNSLYRMEQYDESMSRYDESLRYARDDVRSRGLFNRGNAAYRMESYAEAVEAYMEVLRIDPDDLDAKHNLELALRQLPPDSDSPPPEEDETSPPPQSESPPPPQAESPPPQDEPMTGEQARQVLEAVGEDAQTLQERREQSLLASSPQTEFDW